MSAAPDERDQGAHPFTVAWWNTLPACYRRADRVQGYRKDGPWDGYNRDPRFITGWDSWWRTNTSTKPWVSSVSFTRTFRVTPHRPVHIRSWHHPWSPDGDGGRTVHLEGTRVRHLVRNYTGNVVANHWYVPGFDDGSAATIIDGGAVVIGDEDIYDGGTPTEVVDPPAPLVQDIDPDRIDHHTLVWPDRFGVLQVIVEVFIDVPDARDLMDAVHVGGRDATFAELPGVDYFAAAAPYPLLRYMDGMGHQFGYLSDAVNDMHSGKWVAPLTAPEQYLTFLASIMGVSDRYVRRLTLPQLRQHLVDLTDGNSPAPGSRRHIAITAQQWLTGTKDVAVVPAHTFPTYRTGPDQALIEAVGYTGRAHRLHVARQPPVPDLSHRWAGTAHASTSERVEAGTVVAVNRVPNPGFESAGLWTASTAWTWEADTTRARSGTSSARVERDGGYGYLITGYLPTGGTAATWRGSLWVYSEVETTAYLRFWAYDDTAPSGEHTDSTPVTVPAGRWTQLSLTASFTAATTRTRFSLYNPETGYAGTTVWVDEAMAAPEELWHGTYFDGDTPDATHNDLWVGPTELVQDVEYTWGGLPGLSTSARLAGGQITHHNQVPNPGVSSYDLHTTSTTWSWAMDTVRGRTAPGSARVTRDGGPGHFSTATLYAAAGEKTWQGSAWVYSEVATVASAGFLAVAYNAADGTTSPSGEDAFGPVVQVPPGIWTELPVTATFTDVTRRLHLVVRNGEGEVYEAGDLWVDDLMAAEQERWHGTYFDGDTADSGTYEDWLRTSPSFAVHTWDGGQWVAYTAPAGEEMAVHNGVVGVVNERAAGDLERLHTLIVFARANEVPDSDLPAFEAFLNTAGVIPAGHRVLVVEAVPTWDEWEAASGATWNEQARVITTWNDSDSAGINLGG